MSEKNPYPAGSYRAKLWERKQREKAGKESPPEKKTPVDEVEEEKKRREKLGYLRKNQTTDDNN